MRSTPIEVTGGEATSNAPKKFVVYPCCTCPYQETKQTDSTRPWHIPSVDFTKSPKCKNGEADEYCAIHEFSVHGTSKLQIERSRVGTLKTDEFGKWTIDNIFRNKWPYYTHTVQRSRQQKVGALKVVPYSQIPGYRETGLLSQTALTAVFLAFEIFTVLLAVFDVVSDILVVIEYYKYGLKGFFFCAMCLILLSNLALATLAVIITLDNEHNRLGVYLKAKKMDGTAWCILFVVLLLPIGQLLPLFHWILQTFFVETQQNPNERRFTSAKQLLRAHLLFFAETVAESIPQSILQLIVVVLHRDAVTLTQVISLCISLVSICSKVYQAVRDVTDTYIFIMCQLFIIGDVFTVFFCYLVLFSPPPFRIEKTYDLFHLENLNVFTIAWFWKNIVLLVVCFIIGVGVYIFNVIETFQQHKFPSTALFKGLLAGFLVAVLAAIFGGIAVILFNDLPRFSIIAAALIIGWDSLQERILHSHKLVEFFGIRSVLWKALTGRRSVHYEFKARFVNAYYADRMVAIRLTNQLERTFGCAKTVPIASQWRGISCRGCSNTPVVGTVCRINHNSVERLKHLKQLPDGMSADNETGWDSTKQILPNVALDIERKTTKRPTYEDSLYCLNCYKHVRKALNDKKAGEIVVDSRIAWYYYMSHIFRMSARPWYERDNDIIHKDAPWQIKHAAAATMIDPEAVEGKWTCPCWCSGPITYSVVVDVCTYVAFAMVCIVHAYTTVQPILLAIVLKEWNPLHLLTGISSIVVIVLSGVVWAIRWTLYHTIESDCVFNDKYFTYATDEYLVTAAEVVNEYYSQCSRITCIPVLLEKGMPFDVVEYIVSYLSSVDVVIEDKYERKRLTHQFVESGIPFQYFYPPVWVHYPEMNLEEDNVQEVTILNPCPLHGQHPAEFSPHLRVIQLPKHLSIYTE